MEFFRSTEMKWMVQIPRSPASFQLYPCNFQARSRRVTFPWIVELTEDSSKGDLGELILFDQALNQAETKAVESYLHRKWDLPLAYPPVLPPFSVSEDGVISTNRSFDYEELSQYPLPCKSD